MNKKSLFGWMDSPTVPTGFGIVAKNLLRDMHMNFDVKILGINYYGNTRYDANKYFIYSIDKTDPLGLNRFIDTLKDAKPDVIFLFQDMFHIDAALPRIKKEYSADVPIVTYFPVDGSPVSQAWHAAFTVPDKLLTYSQFAVDSVRSAIKQLPANKPMDILYHGVDTTQFYKLPSGVRKRIRDERGWTGKFVVLNNNRFQPRKMIPLTLRAFSLFSKGYKVCSCGNAYLASKQRCDLNNCDASQVVSTVPGRPDAALYLHMNMAEFTMGPGPANLLQAHLLNAGFEDADLNRSLYLFEKNIYQPGSSLTEAELNEIYNGADVNVSTTLGEGCGLSLLESMAVGTTNIAPNNSAIPEVLGTEGHHLIPNQALMNIAMDNGHLRPVVNVQKFVEALEVEYQRWLGNGKHKVINLAAIDRVNEKFLWDDKRKQLLEALKSVC